MLTSRFQTIALFAAILITLAHPARAQIGVELGIGQTTQHGSYIAPCGCTFANGTGIKILGGLPIDLFSFSNFTIGVKPGFDYDQFTSHEMEKDLSAQIANGDQEEIK